MSKRRLVNRCLMGAVLAVPSALLGIYSLGYAQEPQSAAFPTEAELRPVLRIAQAEGEPKAASGNLAALDVPGGVILNPKMKDRVTAGLTQCARCHSKSGANDPIPGLPVATLDDGWCLLNELRTFAAHDKHFTSYAVLLNERSQRMGEILGIVDGNGKSLVHRDQRCLTCHTGLPLNEMQPDAEGLVSEDLTKDLKLNRGVTCEGCHGPSKVVNGSGLKDWYSAHDGSNPDWRYMGPKEKSETFGYYDVRSPVSRARMCASCHVGNADEGRVVTHEMYAAGHPPLPGFEMETFSDQEPQHWRDLRHKPEKIRQTWLEKTAETWRKDNWGEAEAEDTRDMLISACVSLAEYVRLNSKLADSSFSFPLKSDKWSSDTWPELSQFACYACHHDLQAQGWRINRPPIGVPGRPTPYEWPIALVTVALKTSGADSEEAKTVTNLIKEMQLAMVDGPFGNRDRIVASGRDLADRLTRLAEDLEAKPFSREAAVQVLQNITSIAQDRVWDYDSARQLVWAYRITYEELQGTAPNIQDLYDTNKPIEELVSWYGGEQKPGSVQQVLAGFSNMFLLDLREGRVKKEQITDTTPRGEIQSELKVLEWQANLALPHIGSYDPAAFQKQMAELENRTRVAFLSRRETQESTK